MPRVSKPRDLTNFKTCFSFSRHIITLPGKVHVRAGQRTSDVKLKSLPPLAFVGILECMKYGLTLPELAAKSR